jgi:hypothetical protein
MFVVQRALFANLIDYAGLFPPAALPIDAAVRNYEAYRRGEHAWMLGRFVVPAAQMLEVPPDFPLSVLGPANNDVIEVKAATPEDVERIAELVETDRAAGVGGATTFARTVYVEVADLELIDAIAVHGLRAKIRTGGITPDAFPAAADVAAFIRRCAERGVPFKATAGLHHPLRCVKPLTYAPDAPRGTMHGFVNVFLSAALLPHAEAIMAEDDPGAFAFTDEAAAWRGHAVRTEDLARIRREFAISFGSCSFEEPIADLKELGWL